MFRNRVSLLVVAFAAAVLYPSFAYAYIGPGAGFAFIGSAFVFILAIGMFFLTLAFWPIQALWRSVAGKKISKKARTRRVVIVGLDGLSPWLVDRFMEEGRLPNMKALAEEGSYDRLASTVPPISPVAWSTFQTGVNPGAHNIFDFLTRDKRYCFPDLSSTTVEHSGKTFSFGKFQRSFGKAKIVLLRKSQPFWKILGKNGVFSNILRIPITYPPEKFNGNTLSAMCVPDLKGTQGTYSAFSSCYSDEGHQEIQGQFKKVSIENNAIKSYLEGPAHPYLKKSTALKAAFTLRLFPERKEAELTIGKTKEVLKLNEFSSWITVTFKFGLTKSVSGVCRFCLRQVDPDVFLYVTPINIDPEKPALPISHPVYYSTFLAKRQGQFGTLGLMEDTWGRNGHALDDATFLKQTYLNHEERKEMFFDALDRTREGLCACVFDASDRVQHMFWRYLEEDHPAPLESEEFRDAIPEMYEKMDALVGEIRTKIKPEDVLIVMSDHGFTSFRRGININRWLYEEGYLALKEGTEPEGDYLRNVDWSKTRAFNIGLSCVYLNRVGRERQGIVEENEVEALKAELVKKLQELRDPQTGKEAIRRVYDSAVVYRGVYVDDAPDLILGCKHGYRISWESVTGGFGAEVFEDNTKAWSGDHGVDRELVPGVIFSNRKLAAKDPEIVDIAPTVLDLFAIPAPAYMEGKVII